jgi:transglutaminase-like putative cysteine protease
MIRIELQVDLHYDIDANGADFVFNIHAAQTACQHVTAEHLLLNQPIPTYLHTDAATGTRYLRLRALPGPLQLSYTATVDLHHHFAEPAHLPEVPVCQLPAEVIGYIYPSRYCQSDRLLRLAAHEFGALWQGHGRVQAIMEWVRSRVSFTSNVSNSTTSALDNIPARFATGTDFGADPALGPPDFHAYVEVFLGDRWYIFDASGTAIPMAFVRFGTGRDAADVAFATIFGGVRSQAPRIVTRAIEDPAQGWLRPVRCREALSTSGV